MGLFGKSFEEEVQAAVDQVNAKKLGVTGLTARIEGKVVTLTGEASSPTAKGQVMHEFNALVKTDNTLNLITIPRSAPVPAAPTPMAAAPAPVTKPPTAAPVGGAAKPAEVFHVVAKGDTLSAIAKQHYGKASLYMTIFEANRDQLKDPDKIAVGQKLRIPAAGPERVS